MVFDRRIKVNCIAKTRTNIEKGDREKDILLRLL